MIARYSVEFLILFVLLATTGVAHADGSPQRGAMVYRACAACHSLEAGMHLTGPSLADVWGKKVASVADFPRYSKALKVQEFFWDETTLNAWIANPAEFVADSRMTFRGIEDEKTRGDLIAFLRLAMAPGGAKAVIAQRLVPGRVGARPDTRGLEQSRTFGAGRGRPLLPELLFRDHCRRAGAVVLGAEPASQTQLQFPGAEGRKAGADRLRHARRPRIPCLFRSGADHRLHPEQLLKLN